MQQPNSQKRKYEKTQRQILVCAVSAPPVRYPYATRENVALQKDSGIAKCATKSEVNLRRNKATNVKMGAQFLLSINPVSSTEHHSLDKNLI